MKTLGIDIGTTSICGTIIDVLSGEQLTGGKLYLCGNALRKNSLLRKVCRDIFSREVFLPKWKEEAAAEAAMLVADAD
ncbi:MAG: hypothetical protein LUH07_05790 [Lachnospiraceae bacterium]|nr:hypothetical protein [Lachnospiraceae bacterium]